MTSPLKGWQILLLIEGAFTVGFAVLTAFMLPWSTETAYFLSDREKNIARLRILQDGSAATDTKFDHKSFFKPLSDWKYYVFASIAVCYGVAASVASNFLTQIIGRFGYSTVKTNLYTVAPYACGTIVMLITAYSSDRFRERGFHLASSLVLVIIGCILLSCLPLSSIGPAYFATFLITMGAYTPSCLFQYVHIRSCIWIIASRVTYTRPVLPQDTSIDEPLLTKRQLAPGISATTPLKMAELSALAHSLFLQIRVVLCPQM